jgi:sugar lactone lactonase YvrE
VVARRAPPLRPSGATLETIHAFAFADGYLGEHRELRLRPVGEGGVPIGLAPSSDGRALYVCEGWRQTVKKIASSDGHELWANILSAPPANSGTDPEAARWKLIASTDAAFPYTLVPDEAHGRLYVSLWAQSAIAVLDAKDGRTLARWPVGSHPNEMLLARDGRLFVAEANVNTVSVLDTRDGRVLEKLSASLAPDAPPGSTPNSLALTPDGTTLFVANANTNALAVFDVSDRHAARARFHSRRLVSHLRARLARRAQPHRRQRQRPRLLRESRRPVPRRSAPAHAATIHRRSLPRHPQLDRLARAGTARCATRGVDSRRARVLADLARAASPTRTPRRFARSRENRRSFPDQARDLRRS